MMTFIYLSCNHHFVTYIRKKALISLEKLPPHPQFPLYTYKSSTEIVL